MSQPPLDGRAECGDAATADGEIERHIEAIAPLPIVLRVIVGQDVDLRARGNSQHGDERRQRRGAGAGDGFLVGGDQGAFMGRHSLRAKEQLRRAQHERIAAAVEGVAQNHLDELVEKERRRVADAPAHEIEIGRLQRLMTQQMVAKGGHLPPIVPCVRIRDRGDLIGADNTTRFGKQRCVQSALDGAGFGRRIELGPRQIGFQEFVRDEQPAAGVAIRQMMAAGEPKILHSRSPRASAVKSTVSAGSSPTSASRKENARHFLRSARECRLRKASWMAPPSCER